jgi:hypothetical protein
MVVVFAVGRLRGRFANSSRPWVWRVVHGLSYLSWPLAIMHGLTAGRAANGWVTMSYAVCLCAVVLAVLIRLFSPFPAMRAAQRVRPERSERPADKRPADKRPADKRPADKRPAPQPGEERPRRGTDTQPQERVRPLTDTQPRPAVRPPYEGTRPFERAAPSRDTGPFERVRPPGNIPPAAVPRPREPLQPTANAAPRPPARPGASRPDETPARPRERLLIPDRPDDGRQPGTRDWLDAVERFPLFRRRPRRKTAAKPIVTPDLEEVEFWANLRAETAVWIRRGRR